MREPFCCNYCVSEDCLERLVALVKKNNGSAEEKLIERAFNLSKQAHEGQVRASKQPYFSHPLETAAILAKMGVGSKVVAAALLHDVLEDTEVKPKELKRLFGREVFSLVDGVTKIDLLASESRNNRSFENLRSLLFATTKDPRTILIKLADKLHNLRTLGYLPARDRKRIASEALMVYVPIAHKIGIEEIAVELEDLAFRHAKPETFARLEAKFKLLCGSKEREVNLAIAILKKKLPKASFKKKRRSVYSIYAKMQNTGKILDELNDSEILIVLARSAKDCYSALGAIHGIFPPLPNKVKDFIAAPKPSFYRVLQTTVFGPKGRPVKIRICTEEMDLVNRFGAVAYSNLYGKRLSSGMKQNLSRLGLLLSNGNAKKGFINALKTDFLTEPIYVFTSDGKLVELPKKSTVLDFAFATEKNWALHILRAKVNGKNANLGKILDSGRVVELFFSKKSRAKRSWISYANNFIAKDAIRKHLGIKK
ncbi:MAG: HD domain-containing protein [archaeon]